jgi:hypothetical protein
VRQRGGWGVCRMHSGEGLPQAGEPWRAVIPKRHSKSDTFSCALSPTTDGSNVTKIGSKNAVFGEVVGRNLVGLSAAHQKYETLFMSYVMLALTNPRAQEFATQGFPRRLRIMVQCINNVFAIPTCPRLEFANGSDRESRG